MGIPLAISLATLVPNVPSVPRRALASVSAWMGDRDR
jgi:hypothetical protein